jgi:molybdopterin adenylyltransferase
MNGLSIGVLTISDRATSGIYSDLSGPEIRGYLKKSIESEWNEHYLVVPDNYAAIKKALIELCDKKGCALVLTTGGTGPAPRDITPEVTEAVCSRMLPGFGEIMRQESLKFISTAILSRQTAGIRGSSLIINLPGKPSATSQCLNAIFPAVPDCLKHIGAPVLLLKKLNSKNS